MSRFKMLNTMEAILARRFSPFNFSAVPSFPHPLWQNEEIFFLSSKKRKKTFLHISLLSFMSAWICYIYNMKMFIWICSCIHWMVMHMNGISHCLLPALHPWRISTQYSMSTVKGIFHMSYFLKIVVRNIDQHIVLAIKFRKRFLIHMKNKEKSSLKLKKMIMINNCSITRMCPLVHAFKIRNLLRKIFRTHPLILKHVIVMCKKNRMRLKIFLKTKK